MVVTRSMRRRNIETGEVISFISDYRKNTSMSFGLPFDLVVEILLRLPVKSLIRFKLVCKTWYSLIQSPNFADRHQIAGPVITSILKNSYSNRLFLIDEGSCNMINFDSLLLPYRGIRILGICDGLVCAGFSYKDSDYIIGNPAIREYRRTSQSNLTATRADLIFSGFSSFSNEYKLVRVIYCMSSTGEVVLKAEAYTMSSDSWVEFDVKMARVVHLREYEYWFYDGIPVVLNGIFYWEARTSIDVCVVSFDISSGLFDQMHAPIGLESVESGDDCWRIIEFKEELSFILSHCDGTFELWVLDENKSSWTQKLRIDDIPLVSPVESDENVFAILGYTRSREILIKEYNGNIKRMLLFDLNSRETKSLSNIDVKDFDKFYIYTESLRSTKPRNEIIEAV